MTRFADRYSEAKFSKSGVWDTFPEGHTLIFWKYPSFLLTQCTTGGRKLPCQNQLDSFSRLDRTPNCDGQTDTGPWLVPALA